MLLRALLSVTLLLLLALPAQAVLTLGVAPDAGKAQRMQSEGRRLALQLQELLGEEVRLRVLSNEAELNEWLQRYRMVDLALVPEGFYRAQPAGSLQPLGKPLPVGGLWVVARPGLKAETQTRLRSALAQVQQPVPPQPPPAQQASTQPQQPRTRSLPPRERALQPGQEILAAPGAAPLITAQPAQKARRPKPAATQPPPRPAAAATRPSLTTMPPATTAKPAAEPVAKPAPSPVAPPPAAQTTLVLPPSQPPPGPAPVPTAPVPEPTPPAAAEPTPPVATSAPPETASPIPWLGLLILAAGFGFLFYRRRRQSRPIDWSTVQTKSPQPAPVTATRRPGPAQSAHDSEVVPLRPLPMSRVQLPARKAAEPPAEMPPAAAAATIPLSTMDLPAAPARPRPAVEPSEEQFADIATDFDSPPPELDLELPSLEDFQALSLDTDRPAPASPASPPATPEIALEGEAAVSPPTKPAKAGAGKPPLRGDMATVDIPRLLEAAATQPGPCILHIRGRHDEKRLHFRMGHMSEAVSINRANRAKTGFLMNKVGYLLIRQGRISEEQRDQALRLCAERPKLRIGEALVELGALSRESLLEALRTQAEGVIFSLFIFPEGRYEIVADDAERSSANDLEIDIAQLLNKAASQEVEWQRIRQAIPTLETVLDFPEGGRDKLDSARMTEHQQLVLSLIDGHRPIRDICIAATMLDLEVYKFLFFMVNARILTRIPAP